ncbi:fumarylacetoacetate hydrolase family protein [Nakamurella flavida]|uniref:Fumarylacetoacetate hydrolase family protein n=1 Tax=Nakamurella flavida TaxID=363630 RepID=A0A939C5C9_9ACTN|nr:fumarylacetoacetate hydrolase family protein [Nakamurella flavida]MBM9476057.1 fumarylacetoacetate hydrolase family protein [Nakamurella flavida]MDP9777200.1 2-keto-4-pentenoate hydratase/2-oxohepta-3-ene-1,7-dioic acid hydratase in catechol pathway [Nakamurella flavida]
MRIATIRGRLALLGTDGPVDVAEASDGRFGPDPQSVFADWPAFREWAGTARGQVLTHTPEEVGPPVPRPPQVFAIGLNYVRHAHESGLPVPTTPLVFTKFPSAITGPSGEITLSGDTVDWEVELVVVIGREARDVDEAHAWDHVAGLTAGQDLSDRTVQNAGSPPQFSMGKSFRGFAPIGPVLVTVDEFTDPDDLRVSTVVDGVTRQDSRTSDLVFTIPQLIARLSAAVTLLPGDLIFTGTPEGVGLGMKPPVYLRAGQVLETTIEGIGTMRHTLVDRPTATDPHRP